MATTNQSKGQTQSQSQAEEKKPATLAEALANLSEQSEEKKPTLTEALEASKKEKKPASKTSAIGLELRGKLTAMYKAAITDVAAGENIYRIEEQNYQELKGILVSVFVGLRRDLEDDGMKMPRKTFEAGETAAKEFARTLAEAITSIACKNAAPRTKEGDDEPSSVSLFSGISGFFK